MASLYEQMNNLLTPDSFKEGLAKSAEENKDESMSDIFSFDRIKKEVLPQFREKDEIIEKATATGTGLLTGTLGIPSDIISMASAGADLVGDYTNNPTFTVVKDLLNRAEEEAGRPVFDKWFTETTGLESNPANTDQLIGEILSPTGAFLVPFKTLNKLFKPLKKGASEFFDNFTDGTGGAKLVPEGVADTSAINKAPQIDNFNQPIINLSEIGLKTQGGQDAVKKYRALEKNLFKQRGTEYTRKNYYELPNSIKDDLYRQTGVYRGKEGAFRYKISTAEAQLNVGSLKQQGIIESGTSVVTRFNASKIPTEGITLEEMLNFQPLYIQYGKKENNFFEGIAGSENPEQFNLLKNIKVKSMDDFVNLRVAEGMSITEAEKLKNTTSAVYSVRGSEEIIYVSSNSLTKVRSDILHEVQHAIQKREGFLPGGSPASILDDMTDGNYSLDVLKLGDDQKQILADYYKDYPNLSNNMKNIFKSATTKLIQREFKYMYKNGENLKDTKDVLPTNAGTYRVNLDDDINNISYNNKAITFTEEEATLLNAVADRSNFKSYMTFRAVTERQSIRLLKLEEQAIIKYRYKTGEMQSRRVEKQDALYQEIVQGLRDKGQLGKNEIVSPELQERIFRGIGLDDAGEYKDMFPSKFEGQGVLQDQKIKPAGTNINTYANIKEQ